MWGRLAALVALIATAGATALVVAGQARVVGDGCGQGVDRAAFHDPATRSDEQQRIARCATVAGWPAERVRAELGDPDRAHGGTWRYGRRDGDRLVVVLDRGTVARAEAVDGTPYLD